MLQVQVQVQVGRDLDCESQVEDSLGGNIAIETDSKTEVDSSHLEAQRGAAAGDEGVRGQLSSSFCILALSSFHPMTDPIEKKLQTEIPFPLSLFTGPT